MSYMRNVYLPRQPHIINVNVTGRGGKDDIIGWESDRTRSPSITFAWLTRLPCGSDINSR